MSESVHHDMNKWLETMKINTENIGKNKTFSEKNQSNNIKQGRNVISDVFDIVCTQKWFGQDPLWRLLKASAHVNTEMLNRSSVATATLSKIFRRKSWSEYLGKVTFASSPQVLEKDVPKRLTLSHCDSSLHPCVLFVFWENRNFETILWVPC